MASDASAIASSEASESLNTHPSRQPVSSTNNAITASASTTEPLNFSTSSSHFDLYGTSHGTLTEFTLFPTLPIELRLKIFENCLPEPRIIQIVHINVGPGHPLWSVLEKRSVEMGPEHREDNPENYHSIPRLVSNKSLRAPVIMGVCHEAQEHALKSYQKSFVGEFEGYGPIFIDFEKDVFVKAGSLEERSPFSSRFKDYTSTFYHNNHLLNTMETFVQNFAFDAPVGLDTRKVFKNWKSLKVLYMVDYAIPKTDEETEEEVEKEATRKWRQDGFEWSFKRPADDGDIRSVPEFKYCSREKWYEDFEVAGEQRENAGETSAGV